MTQILTAMGILLLLGWAYTSGRVDGNHGGWTAAWRKAREKFGRSRRD